MANVRARTYRARVRPLLATALAVWSGSVSAPFAQVVPRPPTPVQAFDLSILSGEWFEIAGSNAWAHRSCVADIRYSFVIVGPQVANVVRTCTTGTGVDARRGRVRRTGDDSGALRGRFVPGLFAWLSPAWNDYWVFAVGDGAGWLLIGDRRLERTAIWSRTITLDEASVASATSAARRLGYDVERLRAVPHPAGPFANDRRR